MTQKPKPPAALLVIPVIYIPSLWLYPVASGGLGNLAAFAAWGFTVFALLVLVIGLFAPRQEDRFRPTTALLKWTIRLCVWGGVFWLAYHGAFVLAGVVAIVNVLSLIIGYAQKQS